MKIFMRIMNKNAKESIKTLTNTKLFNLSIKSLYEHKLANI